MRYRLYPWQEACLKEWQKKDCHGIVNVVTGAGKTVLALAAIERLRERTGPSRLRVKIVVPTASLLTQWAASMRDYFDGTVSRRDIGLYCGSQKDAPERPVMIYVINSARYTLARHVVRELTDGYTVFLIADECHRYTGAENQRIFDFLPYAGACPERYASLGLSATPGLGRPESAAVLIPALGPEIYRYGFQEARREDTLCPYVTFQIALTFTPEEEDEYEALTEEMARAMGILLRHDPSLGGLSGSVFFQELGQLARETGRYAKLARLYVSYSRRRKHLTSDAAARLPCVIRLIALMDRGARILIFGERIGQADRLYEKLDRLYPNQTARCHSAMDAGARKRALERFRDGEARILISCRALDEGFDVPNANVGIVMSSASVNRQRIQRLGRILRKYEGKEVASLYYLYVSESSEEASYMPAGTQADAVCELSYDWKRDTLSHPDYEMRARAALWSFRGERSDASLLSEAADCFDRGIIRPDWQMGAAYCERKIEAAKTVTERNYWICMKRIAHGPGG